MMIQRVLKGICGLTDADVTPILDGAGIRSNWWRWKGTIEPSEVIDQLTAANVDRHLNCYTATDPLSGLPYGRVTPFISTTAGAVVRDARGAVNLQYSAIDVAVYFATDAYRSPGWVFFGYLFAVGRPSVPHRAFAEEVRELHVYTHFLPYQPEGELVAKIHIPATQLERAVEYLPTVGDDGYPAAPAVGRTLINSRCYQRPDAIVNLREAL
jgi:hypothetical protein